MGSPTVAHGGAAPEPTGHIPAPACSRAVVSMWLRAPPWDTLRAVTGACCDGGRDTVACCCDTAPCGLALLGGCWELPQSGVVLLGLGASGEVAGGGPGGGEGEGPSGNSQWRSRAAAPGAGVTAVADVPAAVTAPLVSAHCGWLPRRLLWGA